MLRDGALLKAEGEAQVVHHKGAVLFIFGSANALSSLSAFTGTALLSTCLSPSPQPFT